MKTLIYVEESENALARALIQRKDINLVLIRFSNCLSFSKEHLDLSKSIPTFIINKKTDFDSECLRLKKYLENTCTNIDMFYNDSEFNQVYIQNVAKTLNLPGALNSYQANLVRDKYLMKQFIVSLGLECPAYKLLQCKEDVLLCAQEWGYPFIIKWRIGVSSIEVYKITSPEDIYNLTIDFSSEKYIAEEYQPDKIWCIDAIVSNGIVLSNLYTWLPFTNLDFAENKVKFTQMAVGYKQHNWKFDARYITQELITHLGLKNGYLHLELFVSSSGTYKICEFAWRTPGDHMLQNFSVMYGESIEDYLIDIILGKKKKPLDEVNFCVADVFLPLKSGVISSISTIDDLLSSTPIINGEIYYKVGDYITSQHKYTDSSGWVQVTGKNPKEILEKMDIVYDKFIFSVE